MRTLNSMLDEYAQSHQNEFNQKIHKICVPAIMFSIIGLLWAIPTPSFMPYGVNFATIVSLFVLVYYFVLSAKYFALMIPLITFMYWGNFLLAQTGQLLLISIVIFLVSWFFQFWGHKVEGKKPSFFKDLLFLLIGPLWVAKALLQIED
jgi:uncharacterized membrane protein YGL010W